MSYYPSHCDHIPPHDADPCEQEEFGRLRSVGFIRLDYSFDHSDAVAWHTGIATGQIISIPETNGQSPRASVVTGPPYGIRPGAILGYEFSATYYDPNFNSNCDFYNQLSRSLHYFFFYRTSSHLYITDVPVSIAPNRDIKNDLNADVVWEVDIRWISRQHPCGVATPDDVFEPSIHAPTHQTHTGGSIGTGGHTIGTYTGTDIIHPPVGLTGLTGISDIHVGIYTGTDVIQPPMGTTGSSSTADSATVEVGLSHTTSVYIDPKTAVIPTDIHDTTPIANSVTTPPPAG